MGCDLLNTKEKDENETPPDIEIAGSWAGTDDYGGPFVITQSNTSFTNEYETGTVKGTVESFDNDANFMVVKITENPLQPGSEGKYIKSEWLTEPTTTTSIQSYSGADSSELAKAETTLQWGPYVITKI